MILIIIQLKLTHYIIEFHYLYRVEFNLLDKLIYRLMIIIQIMEHILQNQFLLELLHILILIRLQFMIQLEEKLNYQILMDICLVIII